VLLKGRIVAWNQVIGICIEVVLCLWRVSCDWSDISKWQEEEKRKWKTGQQSKGGGDDNVGLDVPNNNETNIGDDNEDVLDENKNNGEGKYIGNDANVVGKSSDGDNGDGDNSNGIVNSIGGNDSNDVGNPPVSGDAVGEKKKLIQDSNLKGDVTAI
jgi:hypothetical protein